MRAEDLLRGRIADIVVFSPFSKCAYMSLIRVVHLGISYDVGIFKVAQTQS